MAHIDYENNLFLGRGTFEEREIFRDVLGKFQGFTFSKEYGCWTTGDVVMAQAVKGVVWTDRAMARLRTLLEAAKISEELSWRSDTTYVPPSPPGLSYLPYQRAGIEYALMRKDTLIADQPGLGKMASVNTPVLTPSGWRRMGDLAVGDDVIAVDGQSTRVIGVYPQGILPNYRVRFRDGTTTNCGADHLWAVGSPTRRNRAKAMGRPDYEYTVKSLQELMDGGLTSSPDGVRVGAKWYVPLVEPVAHPARDLPIDPYILGVLLGDGALTSCGTGFSNPDIDADIRDEVSRRLPDGYHLRVDRSSGCPRGMIVSETHKVHALKAALRDLGLNALSGDRFIPEGYILASVEQRLSLLRGLMDTDGSSSGNRIAFHTTSPRLAAGVAELVRSLGGVAIERWYDREAEGKPAECQVNVKMAICPFFARRKARNWSPQNPRRYIHAVERIEDCEQVCIAVDHPRRLYVAEHYIVTHNTIQAIGVLNADETINSALFIVPASLKINWHREIDKWMLPNLTFGIAEAKRIDKELIGYAKAYEYVEDGVYKTGAKAGQPKFKKVEVQGKPKYRNVETSDYWPDTDVVIINYDILERFAVQIKERNWDYLVCDECHALKSAATGRTLFVLGGKQEFNKAQRDKRKAEGLSSRPIWHRAIDANRRVFLSGTPMMSRPVELWPVAHAFNPSDLGRDYVDFAYRYCAAWTTAYGLDVSGASNLEELGQKARASFMVRRLKREVLPELPPKRRIVVTLDSPEIRELVAREDELAQALRLYENVTLNKGVVVDEINHGIQIVNHMTRMGMTDEFDPDNPNWRSLDLDYAASVAGLEPPAVAILFEEMAKVRRDLGLAKLSALKPWMDDFLEGGEKLLMFAYHSDVVKALALAAEKWNPAVIWGGTPLHKRQGEVDKLQGDESCRLFIGNIQAAGVGFTMTRAHDVAFAEGDWVPSQIEQCEDRACRIGQTAEKINSYFLVANGSLDSRIAQAAKAKEDNINLAMGA
ncbi:helicase [Brevundimonas phage vB_BpoS-Papperlapapp]|nr:helicase [Brevundimonas phage vB_BpoS-Papperlapapp]